MKNTAAEDLFNQQFKFQINQEVRHKGDNKHGMHADLGLLIIQRSLLEQVDDDGNTNFSRNYVCRMIRFSGSGDLAQFKESELLTIADYNKKVVQEEADREEMHIEMYATKKEIAALFGVKSGDYVYLMKDGAAGYFSDLSGYWF